MNAFLDSTTYETLDPDNWSDFKNLGQRMVADMADHIATLRDRPAWQSFPDASMAALVEDVPRDGQTLASIYETFQRHILPFPTGNAHPGFWGWVMGNGTPTGMLADMLASGMNPHVAGYDQAAAVLERIVIGWLGQMLGMQGEISGLLVSGGTMANLNGLVVARHAKAGFDIREEGLQGKDRPLLTVYGSVETHRWILTACELMGLGRQAFRPITSGKDGRVKVDAMRAAIQQDLSAGHRPFCVLGTVGTVNTGAVDDIAALRMLADEYKLWLHVDGAFGSMAALAPNASHLVQSQNLANSIAFDLHKWGYMPYEVGCVLVRDPEMHKEAFASPASYLSDTEGGVSVSSTFFADRGIQLSRGFRALKVWMSLKEQGIAKIGRLVQRNIDQAAYLGELIQQEHRLLLMAPVSLNIVCFRYQDETGDLQALNEEILRRLQVSGRFVPSHTRMDGEFAIRVCITNHRTLHSDLDAFVQDVIKHGEAILQGKDSLGEFKPLEASSIPNSNPVEEPQAQLGNALVRKIRASDREPVLLIARELVDAADTYAFDSGVSDQALWRYWNPELGGAGFVVELDGEVAGVFVIKRNHAGPAAHVANASYAVHSEQRGRGLGKLMGRSSLDIARDMGFRAMQFNIVLANNHAAIRAWRSLGFEVKGTIPKGYQSPSGDFIDFHIMHRVL